MTFLKAEVVLATQNETIGGKIESL